MKTQENSANLLDQLAADSPHDPINPIRGLPIQVNKRSSYYSFYLEIKTQLQDWWDEFNTRLDSNGRLYYRTLVKFAKEKGKTRTEQELILEMIGPRPELSPGRKMLRVPWLGDWQKRRDNGFWAPKQRSHFHELAKTLREKVAGWEKIQAAAPLLLVEWAKLEREEEELMELFGGRQFDLEQSPTGDVNRKRFETYWAYKSKILERKYEVFHEFMKANGVNPDNPVQMFQVNAMAAQFNSPGGIMDEGMAVLDDPAFNTGLQKEGVEILKVAKSLALHARTYNLPLPKTLSDPTTPPQPEPAVEVQKGNGKV